MVTIQKGSEPLTLINVFTVERENQQKLVDVLGRALRDSADSNRGY